MKKTCLAFLLTLVLLFSITACGTPEGKTDPSGVSPSDASASSGAPAESAPITAEPVLRSYPVPEENIRIASEGGCCATAKGGYYNCGGEYLRYQSMTAEKSIPMCMQPGCEHKDNSCAAYMGGRIRQLAEYRNKLYALVQDAENRILLVCREDPMGEQKTLLCWEPQEIKDNRLTDTAISLWTFAHGKLYYDRTDTVFFADTMEEESSEKKKIAYDLADGSQEELPVSGLVYGDAGIALVYREHEFHEESGDELTVCELRFYDPKTWDYTVIAEKDRDGFSTSPDPAFRYGSLMCYKCENTLYTLDTETGLTKALVTPEEKIINFWMLDGKIFYITQNENMEIKIFYADLSDLIPVQLENKGNTNNMEFCIETEGLDYFATDSGRAITKEDFYTENYK